MISKKGKGWVGEWPDQCDGKCLHLSKGLEATGKGRTGGAFWEKGKRSEQEGLMKQFVLIFNVFPTFTDIFSMKIF